MYMYVEASYGKSRSNADNLANNQTPNPRLSKLEKGESHCEVALPAMEYYVTPTQRKHTAIKI